MRIPTSGYLLLRCRQGRSGEILPGEILLECPIYDSADQSRTVAEVVIKSRSLNPDGTVAS